MIWRDLSLACALLASTACVCSAFPLDSETGSKLYSRLSISYKQETISSRSSSSSGSGSSSSSSSSSGGASSAGLARQLMAAKQRKCMQYAAQVNNHIRRGYKLEVQKYRNPQQCPAVCKTYDRTMPSGVFRVQCIAASCTCTATPVKPGAKVTFGITDAGRFSLQRCMLPSAHRP
ncbi:hypothetical protein COO60DRAFT_468983 [Scenedesmus sp. NREL 46B-D3]|nr:hypothetical protein COO60DRAFT_468983 [Scenedesmus sp. NREL 46B-D3]